MCASSIEGEGDFCGVKRLREPERLALLIPIVGEDLDQFHVGKPIGFAAIEDGLRDIRREGGEAQDAGDIGGGFAQRIGELLC
mgnify:CR=1 FL=1